MGPETSDDAGVYRLTDDLALVETADIITPLVDDPFTFGRIAAANALSDVYAMGGRPVTALNLAFFPVCTLSGEILADILAGGASMLALAGVSLAGGHTVEDDELKYGLAVTGVVHPERIIRNSTARPGDILFLTKPLGFGIISTAIKAGMADDQAVEQAIRWMTTLNDTASKLMVACGASACTDVTGFGLIGHALEMAAGAGVTIRLQRETIPLLAGVGELVRDGMVPAGCYRNRDYCLGQGIGTPASGTPDELLPLFDPQTSGGLLISIPATVVDEFVTLANEHGCPVTRVGEVLPRQEHGVVII